MRHLKAINRKAARVVQAVTAPDGDVVALQQG
ncbi:MAG TPA: quinohemoprotein amine dehydrogenase, partial [Acidobacteria bacterium]|nr:quinohemoprotein amine dehydrogenase [Acidobacteriota bacterium]